MVKGLRIISKQDGFRRGGMAHSGSVVHPLDAFTTAQVEALKAEPLLVVEEVDLSSETEKPPKSGSK